MKFETGTKRSENETRGQWRGSKTLYKNKRI